MINLMPEDRQKFVNASGTFYTQQLFFESTGEDKTNVLYTLKDFDWKGYPSLYRLYMELADVTEYEFANTYLASWAHWEKLTSAPFFKPYIKRWRIELELSYKSKALREIMKDAQDPLSRTKLTANRYLLEKGWVPKESKGRPKKEDILREAKSLAEEKNYIDDAYERIIASSANSEVIN